MVFLVVWGESAGQDGAIEFLMPFISMLHRPKRFALLKDQVMKRGLPSLVLLALSILGSTGCLHRHANHCNTCNGPIGCRPCKIGWQRGGTDYGAHLSHSDYRHDNQVGSGVPGPTVGYPYYTSRGPRDFLVDNPPSIGR